MFEAQLAYYLDRYLGRYVYGLDAKALKVSVFSGDVVLTNLQLKPSALADLNLPINVKAGLVGKLTLKVGAVATVLYDSLSFCKHCSASNLAVTQLHCPLWYCKLVNLVINACRCHGGALGALLSSWRWTAYTCWQVRSTQRWTRASPLSKRYADFPCAAFRMTTAAADT